MQETSPGIPNAGTLDGLGDTDLWRLALEAGKQFRVTVTGEVGFELLTDVGPSNARTSAEALFLDTYPLVLSTGNGFTTNIYIDGDTDYFASVFTRFSSFFEPIPYFFDFFELTDDAVPDASTSAVASVGTPFSGLFEFFGDEDWVRLDVASGDNYSVGADAPFWLISQDSDTGEMIRPPSLAPSTSNFAADGHLGFFAEEGVVYFAVLAGGNNFDTLPYTVTLGTILSDVANSPDTTLTVSAGATAQGIVNVLGDYDWVRLNTDVGASYIVEMGLTNPLFGTGSFNLIEVDAASGSLIDVFEGLTGRSTFSAQQGSEYFVEVIPTFAAANSGTYEVSLESFQDDFADNVSTSGVLTVSAPVTVSGTTSTDVDFIRLDVEAGQSYLVSSPDKGFDIVREDQTGVTSVTALGRDFSDPRVGTSGIDLSSGRFVSRLDPEAGFDYYVVAEFGTLFGVQDATFALEETQTEIADNASTTASVGLNQTFSGQFESPGDQDWILIDVQAGSSAAVSIQGFLSGSGFEFFAVSSDGTVTHLDDQVIVQSGGAGQQTVVTGRSDADIYLQLGAVEGQGLGSVASNTYSITLAPVSDAEPDSADAALIIGPGTGDTPGSLIGNDTDETLFGQDRDDRFIGNGGNDILEGNIGTDTAVYRGDQSNYTLTLSPDTTRIADRQAGRDGTDTLRDIELLDFETPLFDGPFDLGTFGGAASLNASEFESFIELYIAYFNRAPDAVGLNFWGTAFANGTSLAEMASLFIDQAETRATYPDTLSNTDFVTAVYDNVLGRIPDELGFNFWVDTLNSGEVGIDRFILSVLEGTRAAPPAGATQDFLDQAQADRDFLANKTDIGAYFAVHRGMSNTDNATAAMSLFDGTATSLTAAVDAIDGFFTTASSAQSGEFLIQVTGILDDPFSI